MAGGSEPLRWQYRLGLSCQMGPRRNNEDNFYFNGLYKTLELADKPMELSAVAEGSAVAAVCDGMGGESFGEYAAWSAAVALAECARALDGEDQVRACIREMNRRICAEGARRQCRMGCTLALAVLLDGTAQVYNVGDSRIYHCAKGKLRRLSVDHTAAQELLNMGLSVPKGSRKYDQLTQYLGLPEEELLLEAHRAEAALETGDRLLLCSDGLTDAVQEEEITLVLSDGAPPDVQALRLTRRAERAGGKDNVTALVIEASC